MISRIGRWTIVATFAGVASLGLVAESPAQSPLCSVADGMQTDGHFAFDFGGSQYDHCFRDVVRGGAINAGMDFGDTDHTSLNIGGAGPAGGRTWMTIVDQEPADTDQDNMFGSEVLCADILIQQFNNSKGAGLVALFNQGPGKGLALVLTDAGNADRLTLSTVDTAQGGSLAPLASVLLGSKIAENTWYRVIMTVLVDDGGGDTAALQASGQVIGQVFGHEIGTDPNSALTKQLGKTLTYGPGSFPEGIEPLGQNGIIGSAVSAIENSSVTNYTNIAANCFNTSCIDCAASSGPSGN